MAEIDGVCMCVDLFVQCSWILEGVMTVVENCQVTYECTSICTDPHSINVAVRDSSLPGASTSEVGHHRSVLRHQTF